MRSLALYTKMGFAVREPLVFITRPAGFSPRKGARALVHQDHGDREALKILGFSRGFELRAAKGAMVVAREPSKNYELLRGLLEAGYRGVWPATLMTSGPWTDPAGAFLPSIAY